MTVRIAASSLAWFLVAAHAPALAAEPPAAAPTAVAVTYFESNEAAQELAPSVSSLVASRLSEVKGLSVVTHADVAALLGAERQRMLLGSAEGCANDPCINELGAALGARFLVRGRLDGLGDRYLLTASVVDTKDNRALAQSHRELESEDDLPLMARVTADTLAAALVQALPDGQVILPPPLTPPPYHRRFSLGLRMGNAFVQNLAALNPSAELELGYQFHPAWVGFFQLGINYLRARDADVGHVTLLPGTLGVRRLFRVPRPLQPYLSLGLGLQASLGDFGILRQTGALPSVMGAVGMQYLFASRWSVGLEGGINVVQAVTGLNDADEGDGFNLDLSITLVRRF